MATAAEHDEPFGVLDRITAIFDAFGDDDRGLGVSELAARAGLPKSTVSRLVADLVRQRYLDRNGSSIHLGVRLFELGQLAERPQELRFAAHPVMADLRSATGEAVHVAIRDGREMVYIAVMRGRATPSVVSRVGGRIPVHATALGKAVIAHAGHGAIADVIAGGLPARTPSTITDPEAFRRQLAEIRATGLAFEIRESAPDVACAASPVFAPDGTVIAAISASGPADDFDPDRTGPAVRTAALTLKRRLIASSTGQTG